MKQTKDVICCVVDNCGSYLSVALRLAREYSKVYYTNPSWQDAYPKMNKPYIGMGYEEIEVIDNIFDVFDKIDLWVFPDVYYGALQQSVNESQTWSSVGFRCKGLSTQFLGLELTSESLTRFTKNFASNKRGSNRPYRVVGAFQHSDKE